MGTSVPEAPEELVEVRDDIFDDVPDIRVNPSSPQKEVTENINPSSPSKAPEDPDTVIVTGTGYSKPATAVLTKHTPKDAQVFEEKDITKLKLPHYEKLEFEELYSGFVSRLETSHEMEKSLANLMQIKNEESLTRADSTMVGLKESLAEQLDAQAKFEEKFCLALIDMEKMKAEHKRFEDKAHVEQAAILKRAEQAEEKLKATVQELSGLKRHISNMTQAIFGPRAATLQNDCILKLKAIYTLT
ncbi:hypothetical protein ZWY2020_051189 [Hordeum vulgare]|nr:hypothetical protein ZWY2020_051189 [Hordeum vulgare]